MSFPDAPHFVFDIAEVNLTRQEVESKGVEFQLFTLKEALLVRGGNDP